LAALLNPGVAGGLPVALDVVLIELRVAADDAQSLYTGLGDQEPVDGIPVLGGWSGHVRIDRNSKRSVA